MRRVKIISLSLLLLPIASVTAQILKPAKWTTEVSKKQVAVGDEIELTFRAKIAANWRLYAYHFEDCVPIQATIALPEKKNIQSVGDLIAYNPTTKHDETFDSDVKFFNNAGAFK